MILDAGVLIAIERGERPAVEYLRAAQRHGRDLHTSEAVIAQVWRRPARQALLARALRGINPHPLDDGRSIGRILDRSGTTDVIDAHLGLLAQRLGDDVIVTGDVDDITRVVSALARPVGVLPWPPRR